MTDITSHREGQGAGRRGGGTDALLLGFAISGLLWILSIPDRGLYMLNEWDIPALADGLLLAPDAHWQDWFTRGYSHFWDVYPEWPPGHAAFTRPAFQFLIYLAHFALDRDWASYQIISCFAAAGMAAVAFHIARTALGLRGGLSLLAAILVLLSPPVVESWLRGLAFGIDPLAAVIAAGAFLSVVARRDFLCLMLLFLALLTKENAVWAPLVAAITIMLRPKPDEPLRRQAFAAVTMFLPVVMWLGLRFAFFDGIGGTYATAYAPVADFLGQTFVKLTHMNTLFVPRHAFVTEGRWALLDRTITIGTKVVIYALLSLWALRIVPETVKHVRYAMREMRWPRVDVPFLATLWAAIALAFYFALPLSSERYAAPVVMFAWPALVAEIERRRKKTIWLSIAVCCLVSLTGTSNRLLVWRAESARGQVNQMEAALRQVPMAVRQVYILSSEGRHDSHPEYVRRVLGVSAEIVRVIDINWECGKSSDLVAFDHSTVDGVVHMTATLPDCANFVFNFGRIDGTMIANGSLYRSATMSYELPEAHPIRATQWWEPAVYFGRKVTVHVRPNGPARFIIQHGAADGIAWFDTP